MTDAILERIRQLVSAQTGLWLRDQELGSLRDTIRARMTACHLASPEEYYRLLVGGERSRSEQEQLMILLTTGETYFFRDSGQFALLRDSILPELIQRAKATQRLRIWSAACSSGEEAYSLAMLLDEILPDQRGWDILIMGTDVNEHALVKARQGAYTEWSFRATDAARRRRFFRQQGNSWALEPRIRERVSFRNVNLLADPFPNVATELVEMDLILCRNFFIYILPEMVSSVTNKLTDTLAEGGYLVTGHGELYAHQLGKLRTRIFPEALVYQKVSVPVQPAPVSKPPDDLPVRAGEKLWTDAKTGLVSPPPISPAELAVPRKSYEPEAIGQWCLVGGANGVRQAWKYANEGKWDQAASCCREMMAANPLDAEPYYLSALMAQERGDIEEAKALLKKTIYLLPDFVAAYLELGDLYEREHNRTQAMRMRTTALELLQALPPDEPVKQYGASTAREIVEYVQQLLKLPPAAS